MVRIAICLVWLGAIVPLSGAPPARPYSVESYDVSLRIDDLAKQHLAGEARIRIHSQADAEVSALEMDAGALQITSVMEGQAAQSFDRDHNKLFIVLTRPLRADEPRTITVAYQGGPAAGLRFFPDQIYTSATSDWMPCNDSSGERATLHLTITAPAEMKAAASGKLTATRTSSGQSVSEWQLDSPTEPSWFGFAVGNFAEKTSDAEGIEMRILGKSSQIGEGTEIFEPTAAAMHYLGERTGKHYPGETYTQVFVHGDGMRAMAGGLALLPESDVEGLGKQPDHVWLLTDEMAHQWYGIGISVKDWSDLWLSEGISGFLADAFSGQRLGKEMYEKEIQHARQIYTQLRAEGKDRPLSDTGWTTRQQASGEIPEYKGTWFLYLVNQMLGDAVFRDGLRLYTKDEWGEAATSGDLQRAFDAVDTGMVQAGEKAGKGRRKGTPKNTARPLDNLFDLWVYGVPNATSK